MDIIFMMLQCDTGNYLFVYAFYFKFYYCREEKFPTYHKLTRHTTKSTKYSQLQSSTYCY